MPKRKNSIKLRTGHVAGRIVATHTEAALQEPQYRCKARAKTSEVLEVMKDKAGRRFMIIGGQDRYDYNDKRQDVPYENDTGDSVQQVRPVNINASA